MAKRYNRRSTRPLEDLPSLFGDTPDAVDQTFEVKSTETPAETKEETASPIEDFTVPEEFTKPRHQLRFISFGSGSSGNCSYVGTSECGFLVDAGVDNNFVNAELARNGIDIRTIRGIILTHDHSDHVRYSYAILRRNQHMKLYATHRTIEGMLRRHNISRRIKDYHSPIFKEHEYMFDDIKVVPFETSHDGTDNVGFCISMGPTCLVIATDMGVVTERADFYIRKANSLMIESNYDEQMLREGRYPEYLKARIRSAIGHMANDATAKYLTQIYRPTLRKIFLCHLSHDNNTPETAMATMLNALRTININPANSVTDTRLGTVYLTALPRYKSSELYIL